VEVPCFNDAPPYPSTYRYGHDPYQAGLACGFYWTEGNKGLGLAIDAVPPLKGAINSIFCTSDPNLWRRTDLAVKPQNAAGAPAPDVTVGRGRIAFCEDGTGNRYPFRDRFVTPDVWRIGELKPAWVVWYEVQAGYSGVVANAAPNSRPPAYRGRIAHLLLRLADRIDV
jgi:hypothetical protein